MALASINWITTSDKPKFAPVDFMSMQPVEKMDCSSESQYGGSGVLLAEHPLKDECVNVVSDYNVCRNCTSKNSRIIYYSYYGDLVGKDSRMETYCKDCGKFTQYYYGD